MIIEKSLFLLKQHLQQKTTRRKELLKISSSYYTNKLNYELSTVNDKPICV